MSPVEIAVRPLGHHRAELGESPVWDADSGRLHWLDILGQRWLITDPASGETTIQPLPRRISCIARRQSGGWIAAGGHSVETFDTEFRALTALPTGSPGQFNDGKCDTAGRLWIGTANGEGRTDCALWRIKPGMPPAATGRRGTTGASATDPGIPDTGTSPPIMMVPGIAMSNGIGFSADACRLYHVDSSVRQVMAYDLDPATGDLSNPCPFFTVPGDALPDGLAVDAEDHVWLALWGGHAVLRIAPDGRIAGRIAVPTARVSSCCFGGPDLRTLFITTACEGASPAERAADPLMGALFVAEPGVSGLPVAGFAG